MGSTEDRKAYTRVRLRRRGQELLLADGTYLLGRDVSCHVLLDDAKISRRHAKLTVQGDQVRIEDLGSMNGIYVNGVRVQTHQLLFDGDWLTAGAEEIEVCIGELRRKTPARTMDEMTPVPPSSPAEAEKRISSPPSDAETTQRSRALEILASIADRALGGGRVQDAEDLLKTTLLDVSQEASLGHSIEPETLDFAVQYALHLARATARPRWLDYALDLLKSQRAPCSGERAQGLKLTIAALPSVDVDRIHAYIKALRDGGGPDAPISIQRLEQILAAALGKRKV